MHPSQVGALQQLLPRRRASVLFDERAGRGATGQDLGARKTDGSGAREAAAPVLSQAHGQHTSAGSSTLCCSARVSAKASCLSVGGSCCIDGDGDGDGEVAGPEPWAQGLAPACLLMKALAATRRDRTCTGGRAACQSRARLLLCAEKAGRPHLLRHLDAVPLCQGLGVIQLRF